MRIKEMLFACERPIKSKGMLAAPIRMVSINNEIIHDSVKLEPDVQALGKEKSRLINEIDIDWLNIDD